MYIILHPLNGGATFERRIDADSFHVGKLAWGGVVTGDPRFPMGQAFRWPHSGRAGEAMAELGSTLMDMPNGHRARKTWGELLGWLCEPNMRDHTDAPRLGPEPRSAMRELARLEHEARTGQGWPVGSVPPRSEGASALTYALADALGFDMKGDV